MISKIVYFFNEETGFSDWPVFIGLLTLGTVVQDTDFNEIGDKEPADRFGHIVGFSRLQLADTLVICVQWDDCRPGDYDAMHPNHLILVR